MSAETDLDDAGRGTRKVEYRTSAPRLTRCDVGADMDNARAGKVQHFDTRWSHDVQPVGPRRRIGPASNVMTGNRQQVCRFAGHQHRSAFQDQLSPNQLPRVAVVGSAFDIRSLRKLAADGPFTIAESSRPLLAASLSVALVKNDDQGSMRLSQNGSNNTARDDVAAALVLVAGGLC